jgi:hypothetical protein
MVIATHARYCDRKVSGWAALGDRTVGCSRSSARTARIVE